MQTYKGILIAPPISAREIFSACNMDDVFQKLLDPYDDDSETVCAYFGVIAGRE